MEQVQDMVTLRMLEGTANFTPFSLVRVLPKSGQRPAGRSGTRWTSVGLDWGLKAKEQNDLGRGGSNFTQRISWSGSMQGRGLPLETCWSIVALPEIREGFQEAVTTPNNTTPPPAAGIVEKTAAAVITSGGKNKVRRCKDLI